MFVTFVYQSDPLKMQAKVNIKDLLEFELKFICFCNCLTLSIIYFARLWTLMQT